MQPEDRTDVASASAGGVRPMRELADFKVSDDDPDVRGWVVRAEDGTEIGRVDDLMVDTRAMRVQALDVLAADGRHIVVPAERMIARNSEAVVVVTGYGDGSTRGTAAVIDAGEEARVTRAEEELAVGKRRVNAGTVDVHKTVETERVSTPVETRRDEVTVERRPLQGTPAEREVSASSAQPKVTDDEIRVPVVE